uniref:Uncharacterized protein n=1 Tax=Panagrolaimus sp. JU765 TaxID=591449 RepID=A0AC34R385_9BILA
MELREVTSFLLFVLFVFVSTVEALKCKCTQSSWKTTCDDGMCEVPDGNGACLMLDHPVSGRHYACSQSSVRQPDCIEKTTKSGAIVTVCSCDGSDYCNFKMWPLEVEDNESSSFSHSSVPDDRQELPAANSVSSFQINLFLITIFVLLLNIYQ